MIAPQGALYFLHTPFEIDSTNVLLFKNKTAQREYMEDNIVQTFINYTYIRADNIVRVEKPIDELYNCNYVMYRNNGFTDKFFFAFILRMEYINPNTTAVFLAEDSFQTWFYDTTFLQSFVDRCHSSNDTAGNNIVPEEVTAPIVHINSVNEQKLTVATTWAMSSVFPTADGYDEEKQETIWDLEPLTWTDAQSGITCPCAMINTVDASGLNILLTNLLQSGQMEGLMGLYPQLNDVTLSLSRPSSLDGYTPRNKKLLTGQYVNYTFELAGNPLSVSPDVVANPTVTSTPNGVTNAASPINAGTFAVYLTNYGAAQYPTSMRLEIPVPVVQWAYNSYANTTALQSEATAMMLQRNADTERLNYENNIAKGAKGIVGGVEAVGAGIASVAAGGLGLGGAINTGISAVQDVNEAVYGVSQYTGGYTEQAELLSRHNANLRAPATGGSVNANNLLGKGQLYLSGYVWTILKEDAERIDKFFDMYGYSQRQVMDITDHFDTRENWNFIKTSNVHAYGQFPDASLSRIKNLFNAGVTLWHNPDTFGDYSQPNNIV